ncbi:hypothetical protein OIO90_000421 [Microbotryomycetes sp. JL221]|nr:hypothetical protein OIO90_000421 [Microbotryomycetes sp. JL221]
MVKATTPPPTPGRDEPMTASSSTLTTSNSRATLTLSLSAAGGSSSTPLVAVGNTIRPQVTVKLDKHGKSPYSSLALRFVGSTKTTIMGKPRWQAAQMVNMSMGAPGTLVTCQEKLTFLDVQLPLVSPSNIVRQQGQSKKSATNDEQPDMSLYGGTYELKIPPAPDNELLPSYDGAKDALDMAIIGVKYELQLIGKRQGMFKLDDKLSLEIPLCVPIPNSTSRNLPIEQWPSVRVSRPLKFKGQEAAGLAMNGILSYQPLSAAGDELEFQLVLEPSERLASSLLQSSTDKNPLPKAFIGLHRKVMTSPIRDPNQGQSNYTWPSIGIQKPIILEQTQPTKEGVWIWRDKLYIPTGEHTVISKGLKVEYTLGCQVVSPALDRSSFTISMPLLIPSAPRELVNADYNVESGELPAYTT